MSEPASVTNESQTQALDTPAFLVAATLEWIGLQDEMRGVWLSPRAMREPMAPWPTPGNPMVAYLIWRAQAEIASGANVAKVLGRVVTDAWREGGVENYDRGRRDGRRRAEHGSDDGLGPNLLS